MRRLVLVLIWLAPLAAHAQDASLDAERAPAAAADGAGDSIHDALPGLARLAVPLPLARGFALAASGSYGYTGDVLGQDDAHHRTAGSLALSYRPHPLFGVALRLDGRHDSHSGTLGDDDGWIGDTRLELRLSGVRLTDQLHLGAAATVWFPSSQPFMPEADAISPDVQAFLGFSAARGLELVAGLGVRFDRSANSAPDDVAQLSRADRLALGVGDGTALLVGAGAAYTRGDATFYGEWTWDVPVAGDSELAAMEAPMRLDGGVRWRLPGMGRPTLELTTEVVLSQRPDLMADVPLEPVEPRVTVLAGVTWSFGGGAAARGGQAEHAGGEAETEPVAKPVPTQHVRGRLVTPTGEALAGVRVRIGDKEATTNAEGWFELDGVPAGEARLEADLPLPWAKLSTTVVVGATPLAMGDVPVERALPPGQIRGVVRTLTGKPVAAKVTILPIGQTMEAGKAGDFRVDVPPGEYDVVVEAPGFDAQKRHVVVDENGVTVLNVDLRKAKAGSPP